MSYYGIEHPNPVYPQMRCPRREVLTGAVGVHTSEGALDAIAPDSGAENVAGYLTIRTDPGSYGSICDSDTTVRYAPYECETFSIAVNGLNRRTFNIAFACRTTDWGGPGKNAADKIRDGLTAWDHAALKRGAVEIAAFAEHWGARTGRDPMLVARKIGRGEVLGGVPGIFGHGDVQPGDRTDPFGGNPLEPVLWAQLVHYTIQELQPPEDEMSPEQEAKMDALAVAVAKVADDLTALRRQVSMGSKKPDRTMQTVLGLVADKLGVGN